MDEHTYTDFVTALGEEYCELIGPVTPHGDASPQDGYEVFAKMFGSDGISPEKLDAASDRQVDEIRDIARAWHESDDIDSSHIRQVLRRTLYRWPPKADWPRNM